MTTAEFAALWATLDRRVCFPPTTRLFVPDDGPPDDDYAAPLGTPAPTVNLRKPRVALSAK